MKSFKTKDAGFLLELEASFGSEPNFIPLTKRGLEIYRNKPVAAPDPFAPADDTLNNSYKSSMLQAVANGDLKVMTYIEIRTLLTRTEQVGERTWGAGSSAVTVPNFDVQKINTSLTVADGEPAFCGTFNPQPLSPKHKDGQKVWFVILTGRITAAGL